MTALRCWQCGVEPDDVAEVAAFDRADPIAVIPTAWPPGDHPHGVDPPTPAQLQREADRVRERMLENWT